MLMSFEDISHELDLPFNVVRNDYYKAIKKIRNKMSSNHTFRELLTSVKEALDTPKPELELPHQVHAAIAQYDDDLYNPSEDITDEDLDECIKFFEEQGVKL